ncbi:pentapeptide repeat-containing protein [Streptomyces sp. NPDC059639]|uniref:pentapeptide repeat-containing protein n=1 Tax=Streptomyces sp. NPDC059639 TaxID=3346891 RepID=UPI0036A937AD
MNFSSAVFSGATATFSRATFSGGHVYFANTTFSGGEVYFIGVDFSGSRRVSFDDATGRIPRGLLDAVGSPAPATVVLPPTWAAPNA